MPSRQTHVKVGVLGGCGFAAYRSREQDLPNMLLETIGGGFGGYVGSRLPDIIEPALWPGHRQFAHSVTAGSSVAYSLYKLLEKWERGCRSRAEYYGNRKNNETINWLQKIWFAFIQILLQIAAGIPGGLGVGYLSHLALDGTTRSGIPFLQ